MYHIYKTKKSEYLYVSALCEEMKDLLLVHMQHEVALDLN